MKLRPLLLLLLLLFVLPLAAQMETEQSSAQAPPGIPAPPQQAAKPVFLPMPSWLAAVAENGADPQKKKKKKAREGQKDEQGEDEKESPGVRLVMKRRPSLRFGRMLRVDFRLKVQGDFRTFTPDLTPKEELDAGLFSLHRFRPGVQGQFLRHFEFEVEREIREEVSGGNFDDPRNPWRDVYVNFRYFRKFQIRAGKFKVPFGMEQLYGSTDLEFVHRSRISDSLAPARDVGIVAHGRFFERGLNYEAGLFKQDGENGRATGLVPVVSGEPPKAEEPTGQRTFAGRLTGTPLRLLPLPGWLQDLELGGAFTSSTVPPGIGRAGEKGLRGRTVDRGSFFPHIPVHGHRLRLGAEMNWTHGPVSVRGEFMHTQDERRGQGIRGNDLPDLIGRGWYLYGTWLVTGERKSGNVNPRRDLLPGLGIGAWELAARYEQLRFGSEEHPGLPSRTPRAANILGNSDRVWTLGATWYWNRWVKIQFNAVHERIEDPLQDRSPIHGIGAYWMRLVRIQFVM